MPLRGLKTHPQREKGELSAETVHEKGAEGWGVVGFPVFGEKEITLSFEETELVAPECLQKKQDIGGEYEWIPIFAVPEQPLHPKVRSKPKDSSV